MNEHSERGRWSFQPRRVAEATAEFGPTAISAIPYGRPQWIFWDVGLTLVHPSAAMIHHELESRFPAGGWKVSDILGTLVSAAEARHLAWPVALSGDERVHHAWASLLGLPPDEGAAALASCLARSDLYSEIDSSACAVLAEMTRRGVRMGAISNSDGTLLDELAHFGLASYFDVVIDSGLVGVEKPDPAIFHMALEQAQVRPDQAWHIGDGLINDYLGAAFAGMAPVLLDRHGTYPGSFPAYRIFRLTQLFDLAAFADEQITGKGPGETSGKQGQIER